MNLEVGVTIGLARLGIHNSLSRILDHLHHKPCSRLPPPLLSSVPFVARLSHVDLQQAGVYCAHAISAGVLCFFPMASTSSSIMLLGADLSPCLSGFVTRVALHAWMRHHAGGPRDFYLPIWRPVDNSQSILSEWARMQREQVDNFGNQLEQDRRTR